MIRRILFTLAVLLGAASSFAQIGPVPGGGGSSTPFSATVASGAMYCSSATGSDAYACSLSPAPASYAAIIGVPITILASDVGNTGAATLSLNAIGAQAIVKAGLTSTTALVTGDIVAGTLIAVQWNGTSFECLSCMGNYANLATANTWALGQTFSTIVTGSAGYDCNINSSTACFIGNVGFGNARTIYTNGSSIRQMPAAGNGSSLDLALTTINGAANQLGFSGTTATQVGWGALKLSNSRLALTAATMTLADTGVYGDSVTSCAWTNAMVTALGAALTGDITCATLPAKTQVRNAYLVIDTAAGGVTTLSVSCGDAIGGTPFINYIVASDAKAAANTVYGDAVAERGTSIDVEFYYLPSYTATTLVTCHFISTGTNLNTVTTSTGHLILQTALLP